MFKKLIFPLVISFALIACHDNDDSDPTAPVKTITVKGNMSGIRTDGTPFSENFLIAGSKDLFFYDKPASTGVGFDIADQRAGLSMSLDVYHMGEADQRVTMDYFFSMMEKQLTASEMFTLTAAPNFQSYTAKLAISNEINKKYNLRYGLGGTSIDTVYMSYPYNSEMVPELNNGYYYFPTMDGKTKIYFEEMNSRYNDALDLSYGSFVGVRDAEGNFSSNSALYGDLKITQVPFLNEMSVIFMDKDFNDLSSIDIIQGDSGEATNFKYDNATGIVTFDYSVTTLPTPYGTPSRTNTTNHTLKITGSVEAKIYKAVM